MISQADTQETELMRTVLTLSFPGIELPKKLKVQTHERGSKDVFYSLIGFKYLGREYHCTLIPGRPLSYSCIDSPYNKKRSK